ncbi:uncharacterized protein J7T54_001417 [Emericellopsis cladophorae]|uniref:Uncharacterized protein n=1 Tax=Emericellopsis cladophorae TaxID=2686198 RepID=A0A9P9Y1M7_9HYPO|nr:uncharacterized protein J7T54_001417 [Emericellopsis cladophorae]KAI6781455.1 hypothetical protein J7T54_001417 [Emericellopsis cladophorae]
MGKSFAEYSQEAFEKKTIRNFMHNNMTLNIVDHPSTRWHANETLLPVPVIEYWRDEPIPYGSPPATLVLTISKRSAQPYDKPTSEILRGDLTITGKKHLLCPWGAYKFRLNNVYFIEKAVDSSWTIHAGVYERGEKMGEVEMLPIEVWDVEQPVQQRIDFKRQ